MALTMRRFAQASFIMTSLLALVLCPYSKVEESFNLQATHDLFYLGLVNNNGDDGDDVVYDHLKYPGVVPRTFLGPLILSTVCRLIGMILSPIVTLSDHPLTVQFLSRFLLLVASWHAWFRLAHALDNSRHNNMYYGDDRTLLGSYLLFITACQFHMPFYSSRMLPNTFALIVVLHAYAEWLLQQQQQQKDRSHVKRAATFLVMATTIFRCDVVLLLFTVGLTWLVNGDLTVGSALYVGIGTATISLIMTVPFDSFLWRGYNDRGTLVWPEGIVFYYNAILGKSSNWGTSSWHWYLSTAIPKAMLGTVLLLPLAWIRLPTCRFDRTWLVHLLPTTIGFVLLYSCLGHKEMRFLFPVMPMFNLAAAIGMTKLHQWAFPTCRKDDGDDDDKDKRSSSDAVVGSTNTNRSSWMATITVSRWAYVAGVGSLLVTFIGSMTFLQVSRHNYPGGDALELLTRHLAQTKTAASMAGMTDNRDSDNSNNDAARVWIDVASAMSGVSLFGQRDAWYRTGVRTWDKGGYEEQHERQSLGEYTHLLSERNDVPGFHVVNVAQGHPRIDKKHASIVTEDAIYVLERDDLPNILNEKTR